MLVDSHCHLEMESFRKDREEVIKRAFEGGVRYILTVGTEEKYFKIVTDIIGTHKNIYGAIGIHPHNSTQMDSKTEKKIKEYLKNNEKIVAYGEIGLDYFKNYAPQEKQRNAFITQIYISKERNLPIIIHSREAKEDTLEILKDTKVSRGVIHCFSYDKTYAKKFLDLGFYISIPGTITYGKNNNLVEAVRYIPLDRLLSETDAPFLSPNPHRGKKNEPLFVKYTVEAIGKIKNKDLKEIEDAICENFKELFLKDKGDNI